MGSEIKTLKSRLVYSDPDNKWIRLYFDDVEFPDGSRGRFNRIIEGAGHPAVAIVPVSRLGVGLVRQFRYAIGRHVWEIPEGRVTATTSSVKRAVNCLKRPVSSRPVSLHLGSCTQTLRWS